MEKFITHNGNKLYYQTYGTGVPVMLVHGFGETSTVWNKQVDFLKEHFFLIIPNLTGTEKSTLTDTVTMESMADSLYAIYEKENLSLFSLIGHSMGGYITLAFAEKYTHTLNGFGLVHSTAFADSEEKKLNRKKGIDFIKQHGAFEFIKSTTPNLFSSFTKSNSPEIIEQHIDSGKQLMADTLIAYYQAMIERPDRTFVLKNTALPVLFIIGEEDNAVPKEDTLKQTHLPEKSYIHILFSSGHMGMLEEPDKANRILKDFLIDLVA